MEHTFVSIPSLVIKSTGSYRHLQRARSTKKSEEKFGGKEILRIFASAIRETVDENDFRAPVDTRKIDILVR